MAPFLFTNSYRIDWFFPLDELRIIINNKFIKQDQVD